MNVHPSRFPSVAAMALLVAAASTSRGANAPVGRYTSATGTVYDTKTKLTWAQPASPTQSYTWGAASAAGTAQNYCATLNQGGTGWRMPTIGELVTLIDWSQAGAATGEIDPTFFPNAPMSSWSSTSMAPSPGIPQNQYAWVISFMTGQTYGEYLLAGGTNYVRCVR
jgi:hypothetical protein